jgi:hypothetical protein
MRTHEAHAGEHNDDTAVVGTQPISPEGSVSETTPTKSHLIVTALGSGGKGYKLNVTTTPSEADLTDMAQNFLTPSPSPARPAADFALPSPPRSNGSPPDSPFREDDDDDDDESDLGMPLASVPDISILSCSTTASGEPRLSPVLTRLRIPGMVRLRASDTNGAESAISALALPSALIPSLNGGGNNSGTRLPPPRLDEEDDEDGEEFDLAARPPSGMATPTVPCAQKQEWLAPSLRAQQHQQHHPLANPPETASPARKPDALSPATQQARSLVYCRACKKDPCEVPTATMCGHVFCKG